LNLKLISVIIVGILAIDLMQYLSYQDDYAKMNQLDKEISRDKQNLTTFDNLIKKEKSEIETMKAQIDTMSPTQYNKNVDPYNALVDKYKLNVSNYNAQTDIVNKKVNEYNELAGVSRWYLIPIPLPHHR